MIITVPSLSWLSDLNKFAVNRLPAHSDHLYYETTEEAKNCSSMPMRFDLNGSWKFHYTENPDLRPKDFYRPDVSCSSWATISVPGHIQLQGYGKPQYVNTMYPWDGHEAIRPPEIPSKHNPVGSYVTHFAVPDHMVNKPLFLSFQGVESAFYVWLNGQFVGYSEDSFTPAEFELTPFLEEGENKLAVEVYQRSTGSWLEDQDFWRFSGIFRDVYLYTIPEIHVRDLHIGTELNNTFSKGNLTAKLQVKSTLLDEPKVEAHLYDRKGNLICTKVAQQLEEKWCITIETDKPNLWSAEDPYLYNLYIHVYKSTGQLVEVISQRIGFRRFEMVDKMMRINGKRIVFKGVNRHEFNCRHGRVITKEDMIWDIQTMKRNNINAVRTSHYPNQSLWYDLCDEYGIYVIDEMNLETHGSWQKMGIVEQSWNIPGNKQEWQNIVMDRAVSMFERDKNHPSIIIWSCGNESYAGEVILNVSRYFKQVDPTRLVHYEGVYYDRQYDETSDMESRMYAKPEEIEAYLSDNPVKPYISCEYMHAMGNSLGGMYKYTDFEQKYEMYQGGFIWDFIDQSIMKTDRFGKEYLAYGGDFDDRPTDYGFCTNGLVYANRELSPKMQEVKYLYQNFKLMPDQTGITIKNDSLFTNVSQYDLELILYYEGAELFRSIHQASVAPLSEGRVEWTIPFELIKLPGEYWIDAVLKVKKNNLWAEKGYEMAFGQFIFQISKKREVEFGHKKSVLTIVQGDVNIGVHGNDFAILFSKQVGSLISLNYAGREMIASPPAPLFWRATTDNDRGFSQGFDSGCWFAASLARKCVSIQIEESKECVRIIFIYTFSISDAISVKMSYTVYQNGSIRVDSIYTGTELLPQLPTFAVTFKIPADYHQLEWYARGPEENYQDRAQGARLGVFTNTVESNVSGYIMPQEMGNRTGLRRVKITNPDGHGIKIIAAEEPVECTVSPYTAFELENAGHHYELPPIHYTVITIAGRQMGVGGDDSWGAPVQPEHLIQSNQTIKFAFLIDRIDC